MITLHKINGMEFVLNAELIETVEANPDTTIFLTTGKVFIVRETMAEVVRQVTAYQHSVLFYHRKIIKTAVPGQEQELE